MESGHSNVNAFLTQNVVPMAPVTPTPTASSGRLPEGLSYLKQFKQFVIRRSDKAPCSYLTGQPIDRRDPQHWTDYGTAAAAASTFGPGWGIGFALTDSDPVGCLDVDDCRNPVTGVITAMAQALIAMLPGAYVEVSVSGTGLHVWFTYTVMPPHGQKVPGIGELYHCWYIALGAPYEAPGFINGKVTADLTAWLPVLINMFFPPRSTSEEGQGEWTCVPSPDSYGVPADDSELLRLAMKSIRPVSPGDAFGSSKQRVSVSFEDMWTGKVEALAPAWPASGRKDGLPYDASGVDYALASELAYFTGCNCERIERIMRSNSTLVRDRWDERRGSGTWLQMTIGNAVRVKNRVYGDTRLAAALPATAGAPGAVGASLVPYVRTYEEEIRRQAQIAENIRIGDGVSAKDCPTAHVVSLDEMREHFCKIQKGKFVLDFRNPRSIFSFEEKKSDLKGSVTFKKAKGDPYFDDGGVKKKPYDTIEIWNGDKEFRKTAETITFRPGYGEITVDPKSKSAANTWRPIDRSASSGDISMFLTHVEYLFSSDAPKFLDWLAHIEQEPGILPVPQWVHVSPSQGTGRNLLASILGKLWEGYVAQAFDLSETLRTGFNGRLSQRLLVVVDEINEGGSNARWDNSEKLKSLVSTLTRPINEKYGHQSEEWNCARWLIFSNHISALPLTEGDRRFNVVRNDRPRLPNSHYEQLFAALRDPEFIASVAWMLKTRDISGFKPGGARCDERSKERAGCCEQE